MTPEKFLEAWRPPIKILITVSACLSIGLSTFEWDRLFIFDYWQFTLLYLVTQQLGLTFKEKWSSDNILTAEMTIEDQVSCYTLYSVPWLYMNSICMLDCPYINWINLIMQQIANGLKLTFDTMFAPNTRFTRQTHFVSCIDCYYIIKYTSW